jgi:tetratricopeptide (TPR) repeat protein
MMRLWFALLTASAWMAVGASEAHAADKVAIGPAPAWVKPVALPEGEGKPGDAAIRVLLQDQQVMLEPGRQSLYSETAFKVQTPPGLSAGNLSFAWRPDTDVLTVHKLQIRRGNQVIDVLASGQTFTVVRREHNLENAVLDGVLTANIQPEGLQVGDIIDIATTVTSSDPVLKGHVEQLGGAWNGVPLARAHLKVQWPSTLPVRLRQSGGLPVLKPTKYGAMSSIELSMDNLAPVVPPRGAPPRFQIMRMVEFSDFASWGSVAALMAPLFQKAATLPVTGPLQAEVARIRALSPDPKVRAQAALALVQDRVRYVALAMGEGGLVPADAETTWSRRFGDCKAKTALLMALLHALDIAADPVMVSTVFGDGMNERLPMITLFDHVLARATIAGHIYWLDGTRTGDRLDRLKVPSFGWGLPLVATGGELVRILPPPLDTPTETVSVRIDASAGIDLPAPTRIETVMTGDEALGTSIALGNMTAEARDRALRDYWKKSYDSIDVTSTSAGYDPATGEERLVMDGKARMDWSDGSYQTDGTDLGYKADFSRDPGPAQDAPFAVPYPLYTRNVETIVLPPSFAPLKNADSANVAETVAGIEYRRRATGAGSVFTVETSARSIVPEFAAGDAPAAEARLRALEKNRVALRKPARYTPTDQEVAAALMRTPTSVSDFIARGNMLLNRRRRDEAIADFSHAIALDPKNVTALADRGIAYAWKKDAAAAAKDLDAAAAIDPHNAVVFRARGLLAQLRGAPADAITAYTTALELEPGSAFTLGHRAEAYRATGDADHALADAAAAIKLSPNWVDLYLLRATLLRGKGSNDQVSAEASALLAANPDNGYAHVVAARIYSAVQRRDDAMRQLDRAIAIKPEAYIYVNRSHVRTPEDMAGRNADIEAALKLDPKSSDALIAKADLQQEGGNYVAAIRTLSAALTLAPDNGSILVQRGIAYSRSGQAALASSDFAAARAKATEAIQFNALCWEKGTAGVVLATALADCDAGLAKTPNNPALLDSRAFVLLRLGQLDAAIQQYDRAIASRPHQATSLFGRAVAWSRKGDKAKSDADLSAALNADAGVRSQFQRYGVTM